MVPKEDRNGRETLPGFDVGSDSDLQTALKIETIGGLVGCDADSGVGTIDRFVGTIRFVIDRYTELIHTYVHSYIHSLVGR